jgi:putative ABC transport system permease protein
MIKNYLKVAFRNLLKHKGFFLINIAGLGLGMACSMLILLWVQYELSWDNFHGNGQHIYRLVASPLGGSYPLSGAPLAADVKAQIPGVKNVTRIKTDYGSPVVFRVGDKNFETANAWYADPSLLQMFTFPLVSGDAATALVQPNGLLLTQKTARRFFGTEDVVGKTIRMSDTVVFSVTGVLKDIPSNSHLQFDVLLPMSFDARTDQNILQHHYDNLDFYTYLQFEDKADVSPAALATMGREISAITTKGEPTFQAGFALQPLSKIHLYSKQLSYDIGEQGDISYVRLFSIVAFFILFVACINFMNLATARSAQRAREVGIRKTIGARRWQLVGQFLGESILLTFFALLLGMVLIGIALPAFNRLLGISLALPWDSVRFIGGLGLVFLLTSVLSGFYPAFFLSAFRPVKVLKGALAKAGSHTRLFRNGLVVLQFMISVVLIIATAVIYNQMRFIRNRDLGYDKENQLYIPLKGELGMRLDALTAFLHDNPRLSHYSVVSEVPVDVSMGTAGVQWQGKDMNTHPMFSLMGVDEHFLDLFKMKLVAGRGFSPAFSADTLNYVVNEKTLNTMGWDPATAVGRPLTVLGNSGRVIGVVKDFNFKPVQSAIDPLILCYNPGAGKEWLRHQVVINTPPKGLQQSIEDLKTIWSKLNPAYTFEYGFIDQQLAHSYQAELRMSSLFNAFALLAIVISCLGLTGLAAFTAEQRAREIGIRKVLGAKVTGIAALLSGGLIRLVLLATIIAAPVAWYFMHRWLEGFAYRISISAWYFIGAGGLAIAIALATVSWQAVRAAMANPVKSLRAE